MTLTYQQGLLTVNFMASRKLSANCSNYLFLPNCAHGLHADIHPRALQFLTAKRYLFSERYTGASASFPSAAATTSGDDECSDPGRRECRRECPLERATSVVAATTPRPWCSHPCARSCTRSSKPARNQPREPAGPGHARVFEQHGR